MSEISDVRVGIIMGSLSDREKMRPACEVLRRFGIGYETNVMSAHRCPERVSKYVGTAKDRGLLVLIAGAGWAAHLAGAVAANTTLPVIGVPLSGSPLNGEDALWATVQMPPGVPVATVAIDCAYNAGVLAAQMIALADERVAGELQAFKAEQLAKIDKANQELDL